MEYKLATRDNDIDFLRADDVIKRVTGVLSTNMRSTLHTYFIKELY